MLRLCVWQSSRCHQSTSRQLIFAGYLNKPDLTLLQIFFLHLYYFDKTIDVDVVPDLGNDLLLCTNLDHMNLH